MYITCIDEMTIKEYNHSIALMINNMNQDVENPKNAVRLISIKLFNFL